MGAASMAVVLRGYHRRPVVLLLSLLLSLSCFTDLGCTAQKLIQEEADALREIGSKLNKQWDFTVDPCSGNQGWMEPADKKNNFANNVTCACNATSNTCHVISILLKGQNLTGVLPDEFANLTFLTILDLTRNYLNGTIPTKWASLPLTELSLGGNRIYGSIPKELGQIQTLQSISLEANLLQGSIPEALGNLSNLTRLLISSNNLTGELPESLGKLKNLEDLRIDGNPISGKIPSFVGNWINLNRLDMQGTSMEGPFPTTFSTIESITELRVSDWKGGDGKFPSLERMTHMKELVLRNLSISGTIPNYIGMMSKLRVLDLSYNNLTGEISSNLDGLVGSIDMLYLTNNKLNGSIPGWILSSKKNMDLSFNSFTGSAPSSCQIGNVNLVSSFSSTSDNSIAFCLRKNLPCSEKAKNYQLFINCGGNEATVGENKYQADSVQLGISAYQESRTWAYSSTGDFVGNEEAAYIATNTSLLNMSNPELYMNARLSPLSLKYFGLCLQKGYYTVALHFAEIMFTDDLTYCSVGRRYFDVSIQGEKVLHDFNIAKEANGTGKVLVKKFTTFVDDTLEIHFQWTGKGTNSIPYRAVYGPLISAISVTPNFKPNRGGSKLSIGAIIGIVVAASVLHVLPFIWYRFIRKDPRNNDSSGIELQTGSFALKQIKAATKNFDPQNKIGEGGFGPVYKGVLPDGSAIAVKQLSSKSKQGNREFINEIGMISTLKHPNLVKLYGCCVQGDHLMLIYEYMENGSLARALFGPQKNHLYLDWQTRIQICIGIARGLTYLHEESMLKIIHRDIKATNILLDKDFNPKICDFSLARLEEEENTHVNTRVAGTVRVCCFMKGYMAPEYATRGYLTDKVDVYSFGVVTLEIVSGKSNTNYRPNEQFVYLLDWAYVLQEKRNLLELVDERLGINYSKEEALEVLELALACTNPSPTLRPKMSSVLDKLEAMAVNQQASSKEHHVRFKAFKKQSRDTQSSTEKSWIDSSESGSGVKNSHASISRPLLDT